jgi:uncharacterized protein (DUF2249 family)
LNPTRLALTQVNAPSRPSHSNDGMAYLPNRTAAASPAVPPAEAACAVTTVELDLRALPMPEPMERALAAADALPPGGALSVLTPWMPLPLLELLAERGLHAEAAPLPDQGARVWIRRPDPHGTADD